MQKIAGGTNTIYVYDALDQLAAEYTTSPSGAPPCQTCYLMADHLGSTRLVTDESANVVSFHDYLPFGEEISGNCVCRGSQFGSGTDQVNQKFTGQERDPESGLDYFGARYYGSALGRFTSPDPFNAGADPYGPQSWNAYAYVDNKPVTMTDPSGMSLLSSLWGTVSNWFAGGGGSELARCMSFSDARAAHRRARVLIRTQAEAAVAAELRSRRPVWERQTCPLSVRLQHAALLLHPQTTGTHH